MPTTYNTTELNKIFKSRNILIELLEQRGYNVENYRKFSLREFGEMFQNNQLDMLLEMKNEDDVEYHGAKKVFVKYHLMTKITSKSVWSMVEDIFDNEELLDYETDELIIITENKPNASNIALMDSIYNNSGGFINIISYRELQYNKLKHSMVPTHTILSEVEKNDVKNKYNIVDDSKFPDISRHDAIARLIGIRPGQLCYIERYSLSAGKVPYYRICK